jgi:4-diphosphocytidyl-2-C-methyl-D-erythritol kinase
LNLEEIKVRPDNSKLLEGLYNNNLALIAENMINVLEKVTLKEYCSVMYTKNKLQESSPIAALMSGSGPSVFGLFADQAAAQGACEEMSKVNKETFLVRTI